MLWTPPRTRKTAPRARGVRPNELLASDTNKARQLSDAAWLFLFFGAQKLLVKRAEQKPPRRSPWVAVLSCFLLAIPISAKDAAKDSDRQETDAVDSESLWAHSLSARSEGGYRSNVGLSPFHPDKSAYSLLGFEALWFRLPIDGFESTFFVTGSDREYFTSEITDREQEVLATASAKYAVTEKFKAGITGIYLFQDQVFDASVNDLDTGAVKAQVHIFIFKPSLEYQLAPKTSVEFGPSISRANFIAPLDDYWEKGGYAAFRFQLSSRTKLIASAESRLRPYDHRNQTDAVGHEILGNSLEFQQHEVTLSLSREWGKSTRMKSTSSFSGQQNIDNGSGYYDYLRTRVAEHFKCSGAVAAIDLSARVSYYDYRVQAASVTDPSSRGRLALSLSARPELKVTKTLKWYALLEWDRSWSNLASDAYSASTIATGFELEFF